MLGETDAIEGLQAAPRELRRLGEPALLVGVVPDEEHFVTGVERIDLKLIVRVAARDEELDIVVVVDRVVVVGVLRVDQWLLDAVADVEIRFIPHHHRVRVVKRPPAGDDVHEARRTRRARPHRFVELAVDADGFVDAKSGVAGNLVFGAREL